MCSVFSQYAALLSNSVMLVFPLHPCPPAFLEQEISRSLSPPLTEPLTVPSPAPSAPQPRELSVIEEESERLARELTEVCLKLHTTHTHTHKTHMYTYTYTVDKNKKTDIFIAVLVCYFETYHPTQCSCTTLAVLH